MALGMNDFRSIVIKADAANTSIAPIRLSQNDQDGRRIVFELWNGAESIAATGLTARLLFGVGEGGYATMSAVTGAATATWAVDVPQEALQTAGVVRMAVEVASGSQAVCTRIFDAVVEPAIIDEDSPEAQDALSEFRAAVARLDGLVIPFPVSDGGTGATTVATARNNLYFGATQLGGTGSNRQSVTATMTSNNAALILQRGTTKAIMLVDLWTASPAIFGNLPAEVVLVRGAASGSSGAWTIQNNTNQALTIEALGAKFGEVQDNTAAMTENVTRVQMDAAADHTHTPASIGAAPASHEHDASDVSSGTLDAARLPTITAAKGGTGRTTLTSNAVLAGNGTGQVKQIATAAGALFATAANGAASFGILPVAQGGTGSTSAADARTALGVTAENIGLGGTGTREADSQTTSISIASGTATDVCTLSLSAGTWVIIGNASFAANTSGYRQIGIYSASGGTGTGGNSQSVRCAPSPSGLTKLCVMDVVVLTSTTTYYLTAVQNSGSALESQGHFTALRIK